MTVDLAFLTIAEASALIKARQLSPVEYVAALISRTETFDPQLHAYITPTFNLARQQAKQAEDEIMAGTYRGPMHGNPFALKDIYDTKGIRTSGHSKVCLNRLPEADATTTAMQAFPTGTPRHRTRTMRAVCRIRFAGRTACTPAVEFSRLR